MQEPSLALDEDARVVVDACVRVHQAVGPGHAESVYGASLAIELRERSIPYRREARFVVRYREQVVGEYVADFLVREQLIVELKAVERLAPVHHAQVTSYLRASGLQLALLINFNAPLLREGIRRVVLTKRAQVWRDPPLPPV
jgi:GxxExxY protein